MARYMVAHLEGTITYRLPDQIGELEDEDSIVEAIEAAVMAITSDDYATAVELEDPMIIEAENATEAREAYQR